jgi:hypothetical protein
MSANIIYYPVHSWSDRGDHLFLARRQEEEPGLLLSGV